MDMYGILIVSFCVCVASGTLAPLGQRADLSTLLLHDYNKNVSPSGDNGTIKVNQSLSGTTLISLENNEMKLLVWNSMKWRDERLAWSSAPTYENVAEVSIPSSMIWTPDIFAVPRLEPYNGFPNVNVVISKNGVVTFVPPEIITVPCPFENSALYANNTVVCKMAFMSWTRKCSDLDLHTSYTPDTGYSSLPKNKWKLESTASEREEVVYECCPDTYCKINYVFTIRRIG